MRDLKRYDEEFGSNWIPVLDVQQMFGRAGRPQFDREGRALMIARTKSEKDEIYSKYIDGEPEDIYSKLSAEPILRMQVLGLIASGEVTTKQDLFEFFSKTFYAHQYQNLTELDKKLDKMVKLLTEYDFLTTAGRFIVATPLGKRVAELYIDPESAHYLIEKLKEKKNSEMFWLHAICSCNEMPGLRVSPKEFNEVQQNYLEYSDEIGEMSPWDLNYENYVSAFKTALLLMGWINEKSEASILEEYNEAPGNLHNKVFISDWLIYSAGELARLLSMKELLLPLRKLRLRMKNGIKEELLNLIALEGIGRVRARMLFLSNIKTIGDLKKIPYEKLSELIGPKTALKLKEQVTKPDSEVMVKEVQEMI